MLDLVSLKRATVRHMADTSIPTTMKSGSAPIVVVGQTESTRFGHEAMARSSNPKPTASTVTPGSPTTTQG